MGGFRTTGDGHRDAQKVKEHEYYEIALEQVREMLGRIESISKDEINLQLADIFKVLDYKLS